MRADTRHSMRYFVLAGVVAFPLLDFYLTLRLSAWTGVPAWLWFAAGTAVGLTLLANERSAFRDRTLAALTSGQPLLRGLLDSGRRILAGLLFILPGLVSDCIALCLLLLPLNPTLRPQAVASRFHMFEGDYRRVD